MQARYYNPAVGKFISEDPAFLAVGAPKLEQFTGLKLQEYLINPQALNAYSYVVNSPLKYIDGCGEFFGEPGRNMASGQREVANFLNQVADYASEQGGIINQVSSFVVRTEASILSNIANVYDPDAKPTTRAISLGLTVLDVASGGKGKSASSLVGRTFGVLGKVVDNPGIKMIGYTNHGLQQKILRQVPSELIKSTVDKSLVVLKQAGNTFLYLTDKAVVVLDKVGNVVTTYGSNLFKDSVKNIIKSVE